MDPILYLIADHYPWWGIPLAFIFFEAANRYRRRRDRKHAMIFLSLSGIFAGLAVLYFVYSGFTNLRPAMEKLDHTFLKK